MLKVLKIKNIALIENLTIEFDEGLNVLTGETGAGKSIIIDSLNFVLGARTDKSLIRSGETMAKVEALFDVTNSNPIVKKFCLDNDIELENEVLITRTMTVDGKSSIRLNGNIITVGMLKELTLSLVDIYGQQEQVGLLDKNNQLELLDNYSNQQLKTLKQEYLQVLEQIKHTNKLLGEFGENEQSIQREKDYLSFVINEIESQNLSMEEETELKSKYQLMQNAEKIASGVNLGINAINPALQYITQAINALSNVTQYDSNLSNLYDRLQSVKIEAEDIGFTLEDFTSQIDFSENEFDKLDSRIDTYKALQKKYGTTTPEVLNFLENSKQKLNKLMHSEEYIASLQNQKNDLLKQAFDLAKSLNKIRKENALVLQDKLKQNLVYLGMPNAKIFFNFTDKEFVEQNLTNNGVGNIEIMFSANLGQDAKSLNKVASGGELSRVMLAIKSIIAEQDDDTTMVFDEIDTGISGQMAQAVAEKIALISKFHQVLVITHTIQIASMADSHFKVEKIEQDNKTISSVRLLDKTERVEEIARFISNTNSVLAKQSAIELINNQNEFKKHI